MTWTTPTDGSRTTWSATRLAFPPILAALSRCFPTSAATGLRRPTTTAASESPPAARDDRPRRSHISLDRARVRRSRVDAKICAPDHVSFGERRWVAAPDHTAVLQDIAEIGYLKGQLHHLLDQQDRHA